MQAWELTWSFLVWENWCFAISILI